MSFREAECIFVEYKQSDDYTAVTGIGESLMLLEPGFLVGKTGDASACFHGYHCN